jgi:hypothetical protein
MSNPLFANSKAALVFAGITIFGTLIMVGPGGGVLDQTVDRFGQQSEPVQEEAPVVVQEKPKVVEPLDPAAGWGGTGGDAVFGDYAASEEVHPTEAPQADSAPPPSAYGPTTRRASALAAGTGGPVQADSLGTLVPRDGAPEAAIVSRSIDIKAE